MRKQQRTKAHPNKMQSAITEHVARRLREERVRHGLSQTELGKSLGVTFQQIQKYERGSNRLSAAALYVLARELNVPMLSFFLSDENPAPPIVRPRLELELCRHFSGLSEPLQGTIYGIIKQLDPRRHPLTGPLEIDDERNGRRRRGACVAISRGKAGGNIAHCDAPRITALDGIATALNARGVRTDRGGAWHPNTVRNLLAREVSAGFVALV